MKKSILLAALAIAFSFNAYAGKDEHGNLNQGANALAGATGGNAAGGNATGGDSDTNLNLLVLPSTTSATATSGNVAIVCPIITVKSKGRQVLFGLHSDSVIAEEPARVNGICVLYHKAIETGAAEDWNNFVKYAALADPVLMETLKKPAK
jgi:hypothetical protein